MNCFAGYVDTQKPSYYQKDYDDFLVFFLFYFLKLECANHLIDVFLVSYEA